MEFLKSLIRIIDEEWNNIRIVFVQPWEVPWVVPANERDDYEIYFLEKGKGRFIIDGVEYPVTKGDIMFFHTKEENSFIADESPIRFVFITFKIEFSKNPTQINILNNLLRHSNNSIKLTEKQRIQEIFYQMQKEFILESEDYIFKIKLLLSELSLEMLRESQKNTVIGGRKFNYNKNAHESINYIIIYLQNNYDKNITLNELGKLVNLHPRYLCTLFRQVTGKTINILLNNIRIEKAKRLLLYTTLPITDIAMEVGFNDSQYFSRIFKNYENLSPSSYRRINRT